MAKATKSDRKGANRACPDSHIARLPGQVWHRDTPTLLMVSATFTDVAKITISSMYSVFPRTLLSGRQGRSPRPSPGDTRHPSSTLTRRWHEDETPVSEYQHALAIRKAQFEHHDLDSDSDGELRASGPRRGPHPNARQAAGHRRLQGGAASPHADGGAARQAQGSGQQSSSAVAPARALAPAPASSTLSLGLQDTSTRQLLGLASDSSLGLSRMAFSGLSAGDSLGLSFGSHIDSNMLEAAAGLTNFSVGLGLGASRDGSAGLLAVASASTRDMLSAEPGAPLADTQEVAAQPRSAGEPRGDAQRQATPTTPGAAASLPDVAVYAGATSFSNLFPRSRSPILSRSPRDRPAPSGGPGAGAPSAGTTVTAATATSAVATAPPAARVRAPVVDAAAAAAAAAAAVTLAARAKLPWSKHHDRAVLVAARQAKLMKRPVCEDTWCVCVCVCACCGVDCEFGGCSRGVCVRRRKVSKQIQRPIESIRSRYAELLKLLRSHKK